MSHTDIVVIFTPAGVNYVFFSYFGVGECSSWREMLSSIVSCGKSKYKY